MVSVKSVEKLTITLAVGVASNTGTLTLGQVDTQCVPFSTKRVGATGPSSSDDYDDMNIDISISGTTVTATRLDTDGDMIVECFIVEYNSSITVQQGTFTLSGASTTSAVTTVDQTKTFMIFTYQSSVATADEHDDNAIRGRFTTDSELTFSRVGTGGTITGNWYVVEDTGSNWTVQNIQPNITGGSATGTDTFTAVDMAKTFTISSYETLGDTDDVIDGAVTTELTNTTTVTSRRGGTTSAVTVETYVVEFLGSDSVQRGLHIYATTSTQETSTITTIDQTRSTVHSPVRQFASAHANSSGTGSSDNPDMQISVEFQDDTTVQSDRNNNGENDADFFWEVIEWDDANTETFDIDALLAGIKEFTIDALIGVFSKDFTVDAIIEFTCLPLDVDIVDFIIDPDEEQETDKEKLIGQRITFTAPQVAQLGAGISKITYYIKGRVGATAQANIWEDADESGDTETVVATSDELTASSNIDDFILVTQTMKDPTGAFETPFLPTAGVEYVIGIRMTAIANKTKTQSQDSDIGQGFLTFREEDGGDWNDTSSEEYAVGITYTLPCAGGIEFGVDALLSPDTSSEIFTINAILFPVAEQHILPFRIDVLLSQAGLEFFAVDAKLSGTNEQIFRIDALIQALGDNGNCGAVVQSGTATISALSASTDVTIPNAVVLADSFLVFQYNIDDNEPTSILVSGQMDSTTNIHFERDSGTGGAVINITWYVVEYPERVSVQRGTIQATGTTTNQTITSVDETSSFDINSFRNDGTFWGGEDSVRHQITSATNLEFLIGTFSGGSFAPINTWEVIEFTGAKTQRGTTTFASGTTSENIAISEVDLSRSIVLTDTADDLGATPGTPNELGLCVQFTSSTNILIERDGTGSALEISWEVIEFPKSMRVQSGTESFGTTQTVANITLDRVDLDKTAVFLSHDMKGGKSPDTSDDTPATVWYSAELTTDTNLQLTRAGSNSSTGDVTWFAVQFGPEQQRCFEIDARLAGIEEFTIDAFLQDTFTEDFTIDAFLQATQTEDFTIDARLAGIEEFTIDARLAGIEEFVIDAEIRPIKEFTIDARLAGIEEFTIDAKLNRQTTFTIDAKLNRQITFTVDAILAGIAEFTIDSIVVNRNTETFEIDALPQAQQTETFLIDAFLQAEQLFNFSIDGLIEASPEEMFLINAFVQEAFTEDFLIDALPQAQQTETFEIDAELRSTEPFTIDAKLNRQVIFTIDAELRPIQEFTIDAELRPIKEFLIDAELRPINDFTIDARLAGIEEFTIDAELRPIKEFTIDAELRPIKEFTIDAEIRPIKEFTIDAELRPIKEFTIDAFPQATQTKDFEIDARLTAMPEKAFNIDAILKATFTEDFTIDSIIDDPDAVTEDFTIDAILEALGQTEIFDIDALLLKEQTETFEIDAQLIAGAMKVFTVDALLQETQTETFDIDALLQKTKTEDFLIHAVLLATQTFNFIVDAIIVNLNTKVFTIDALLEDTFTEDFVIDGSIVDRNTKDFTIDARLAQLKTFKIDAVIANAKAFSIGAKLKFTQTFNFTIDTILIAPPAQPFNIDSILVDRNTEDFDIDVLLEIVNTEDFTINALLSLEKTKDFTIDARIVTTENTQDFTVDAILVTPNTKDFTIDAFIKTVKVIGEFVDAILILFAQEDFTVNAIVQLTATEDFTIDARIKQEQMEVFTVDSFLRETFTQTPTINAVVVDRNTEDFTIDAFLQALGQTKDFTIDSIIKALGQTENFAISGVLFIVPSYTLQINALLVLEAQTEDFTVDARLVDRNTEDLEINAVLVRTESFTIDALKQITIIDDPFFVDAVLDGPATPVNFTIDSLIDPTFARNSLVDSILVGTKLPFEVDSFIQQKGVTKGFTIDAQIQPSIMFTVDAILIEFPSAGFLIDAQIMLPAHFTIDGFIQLEQAEAVEVDAKLNRQTQFTVDALVKALGANRCPGETMFEERFGDNSGWGAEINRPSACDGLGDQCWNKKRMFIPPETSSIEGKFRWISIRGGGYFATKNPPAVFKEKFRSIFLQDGDIGGIGQVKGTNYKVEFDFTPTSPISHPVHWLTLTQRNNHPEGLSSPVTAPPGATFDITGFISSLTLVITDGLGNSASTALPDFLPNFTTHFITAEKIGSIIRLTAYSDAERTIVFSQSPDVNIGAVDDNIPMFYAMSANRKRAGPDRFASGTMDNIIIRSSPCPSVRVDSFIQEQNIVAPFIIDAKLNRQVQVQVDAIIFETPTKDFTISAKVIVRQTFDFTIDALFAPQKSFTIDAVISDQPFENFLIDARLVHIGTGNFGNACISGTEQAGEMGVTPQGVVYMVTQVCSGGIQMTKSLDGGITWSSSLDDANRPSDPDDMAPAIAVSNITEFINVLWVRNKIGGTMLFTEFNTMTDEWITPFIVVSATFSAVSPNPSCSISKDSNGEAHIIFATEGNLNYRNGIGGFGGGITIGAWPQGGGGLLGGGLSFLINGGGGYAGGGGGGAGGGGGGVPMFVGTNDLGELTLFVADANDPTGFASFIIFTGVEFVSGSCANLSFDALGNAYVSFKDAGGLQIGFLSASDVGAGNFGSGFWGSGGLGGGGGGSGFGAGTLGFNGNDGFFMSVNSDGSLGIWTNNDAFNDPTGGWTGPTVPYQQFNDPSLPNANWLQV